MNDYSDIGQYDFKMILDLNFQSTTGSDSLVIPYPDLSFFKIRIKIRIEQKTHGSGLKQKSGFGFSENNRMRIEQNTRIRIEPKHSYPDPG